MLEISDADAARLAEMALEFFVRKQSDASPQNVSGWATAIQDLVFKTALKNFLPAKIAPLETQAQELVTLIKSEANAAKVALPKLIATMRAERGKRPGATLLFDCDISGLC